MSMSLLFVNHMISECDKKKTTGQYMAGDHLKVNS